MEIDRYLDMKGQVCPIPAAETRNALRQLAPGKVLEVVGDFCPALENVISMAQKLGAEVLSQESGPNFFRAVLKKK